VANNTFHLRVGRGIGTPPTPRSQPSVPPLGLSQPLSRQRVCPSEKKLPLPLPVLWGGAHSLARKGLGGRVPIPTRGHTLWYSLYICSLCLPHTYECVLYAYWSATLTYTFTYFTHLWGRYIKLRFADFSLRENS
jgi:hypothetical protein